MKQDDRVTYTQMAIEVDWDPAGPVIFIPEETWERGVLRKETVDPLNVHKPYGLTEPYRIDDKWVLGVCVPLLLRPVQQCGEQDMSYWLEYWVSHMTYHLRVLGRAADDGETNLPLTEIEQRVTEWMAAEAPDLYQFGERIKSLQQME